MRNQYNPIKRYVVIDIGSLSDGVSSELYGVYKTEEDAQNAVYERNGATGRMRNGGQTQAEYFEVEIHR